jgi:probable phosphomutase (TIGR03848 family)
MTGILLIRHGENDFVGKRLAGHLPGVHLNEKGRKQAELIAGALKEAPIKAIYSSPLERAFETAEPLAAALNLPVNIHSGLSELDFGTWQGKTMRQMHRMKAWKTIMEKASEMRFPQGESYGEVQARMVKAIEEIKSAHAKNDLVACFSHCDSIRLLLTHYLDMPLDEFHRLNIDTASISLLYVGEGRPSIQIMNFMVGLEWKFPEPPKKPKKKTAPVQETQEENQ